MLDKDPSVNSHHQPDADRVMEREDGSMPTDNPVADSIVDFMHPPVKNYEWRQDGLYKQHWNKIKSGEKKGEWEFQGESHLLQMGNIDGILRNGFGRTPHIIFSWTDAKGRKLSVLVPTSLFSSPQRLEAFLAEAGVMIFGLAEDIAKYFKQAQKYLIDKFILESGRGWLGNEPVYICTDGDVIGQTSSGETVIAKDREPSAPPPGTLKRQLELLKLLLGNPWLQFPTLIALSAPIVPLVNGEGGGFNYVGDSSAGKSTGGHVAWSIYHGGKYPSWNATANFITGQAIKFNASFLMLDEMAEASPETVKKTAFYLASGIDRGRADKRGQPREQRHFNVTYFSTGEFAADGIRKTLAGEDVRLCRIRVPDNLIADRKHLATDGEFAEHLNKEAPQCWGHVGRKWIEWLVSQLQADRAALIAKIESYRKVFLEAESAEIAQRRQLGRVAQRYALIYAAGRLASEAEVIPWDLDGVMEAVQKPFNAHANDTGGLEGEEKRILDAIWTMCRTQPARFESAEDNHAARDCVGRRVKRPFKHEDGDDVWDFDFTPVGLQETCSIKVTRQITDKLMKHGWLQRGEDNKAKRVKRRNGDGKDQQYYRILAETLNKYEDAQDA